MHSTGCCTQQVADTSPDASHAFICLHVPLHSLHAPAVVLPRTLIALYALISPALVATFLACKAVDATPVIDKVARHEALSASAVLEFHTNREGYMNTALLLLLRRVSSISFKRQVLALAALKLLLRVNTAAFSRPKMQLNKQEMVCRVTQLPQQEERAGMQNTVQGLRQHNKLKPALAENAYAIWFTACFLTTVLFYVFVDIRACDAFELRSI
jgi:hypothetical protein